MLLSAHLVFASTLALLCPALAVNITDKYIVVLKAGIDLDRHLTSVNDLFAGNNDGVAYGGVIHHYAFKNFQAYAGHFPRTFISRLDQHPDVEYTEQDHLVQTAGVVTQRDATYGLGLICRRLIPSFMQRLNYNYDSSAGAGTFAYVMDSGINIEHEEFTGRAHLGYNSMKNTPFRDEYGHGTHVAATIGGKRFGVAKRCTLIAVKAVDSEGEGDVISALDGYAWAVRDVLRRQRQAKAVINVSLTAPYCRSVNQAVEVAFNHGVTTVVAAGNHDENAARISPASSRVAITVSATDWSRHRWDEANWGPLVDMFAPGVGVRSAWIGSRSSTEILSGTSSAAAHVTGLLLYLKRLTNLPEAKVTRSYLLKLATTGAVEDAKGAKNLFAYNGINTER